MAQHHLWCRWGCREFGEVTEEGSVHTVTQPRDRDHSSCLCCGRKAEGKKGVLLKKLTNPDLRGIMSPEQKCTEHLNSAAYKLGSIPRASSSVLRLQTSSAGCSKRSWRAASAPPQLRPGKNRSSPLGSLLPAPGPCSSCASPPWCCSSRRRGLGGGCFFFFLSLSQNQ